MPVLAQLQPLSNSPGERRRTPRLLLKLGAKVGSSSPAVVHDLSTRGLLFETAEAIGGDRIHVHLPELPAAGARVVWSHGRFYGCEFEQPIPVAAVSTALLRSEARLPDSALQLWHAANHPDRRDSSEPAPVRGRLSALLVGALLLAGAVWLAIAGHVATLVAIGVSAIVILGLLAATMFWAMDNTLDINL